MGKQWVVAPPIDQRLVEQFPNIPPLVLRLLAQRCLTTQADMDEFLSPDYTHHVHDSFLFRDMRKVVERVYSAIAAQEKIAVFGDYDADGVCASTVMVQTLRQVGAPDVRIYIPHRMNEGHSMNIDAVSVLATEGVKLIITVDCGISNAPEISAATAAGVDVIVTDHHLEAQALPKAHAIINPHLTGETYPFKDLCGTGVAFKVAQALLADPRCPLDQRSREAWEKWLLDLVAVGTVADIMPLLGENRTLVRYGLLVLRKTRRLGLLALAKAGSFELEKADPYTIGFLIAPRLNAAGRMDHANGAYELLSTGDPATAVTLATTLQQSNIERQTEVERISREAIDQVGHLDPAQKIVFAYADGWSSGLVGLVASKLVQTYNRPAFALGFDGEKYVGSGRSLPSFDITQAISKVSHLLLRFGGHAAACGCSVAKENLPKFIEEMSKIAAAQLTTNDLVPRLHVAMEMKLKDLTWDVLDQLEQFAPYGQENPRPLVVSHNLEVADLKPLGKDATHLRMHVRENSQDIYKTISFGTANTWGKEIRLGQRIDLVYEPGINQWNGNRELQLKVIDWQPSS